MVDSLVSPLFVGRRDELDRVAAAARRARHGVLVPVLLAGEAGIGKSRLVAEASVQCAEDGWRVLTGGCFELGSDGLPFAPLVDILRRLVATTTSPELDAFLGPARPELAWLLPELVDAGPVSGSATHAQLLELVLGMFRRLADDRPLALVIEDLHWADRSTLELMTFLVRALRDVPVLLLMTYRSDEVHRHHPLRPVLTSWERARSIQRIDLRRLDRDEVAAQLGAILQEPPATKLVDAVFERSEGNAYFVEEVLGILQQGHHPGDLPPLLRDVLLAHVEALSPPAQRVVRVASVAGASVSERLLMAVAGLESGELSGLLREIVQRHLLLTDAVTSDYSFRHALTREAVYRDMLPGERVQLHAAYAAALAASPEATGRSVTAMLAHHWYAALDLPRALAAALDAGRLAATQAPADAQQHFERVLELWARVPDAERLAGDDHVGVLQAAASAAYNAGSIDRCLQLADQALSEQPVGTDDGRGALLLEFRARALRDLGREAEGFEVLAAALDLVAEEPPTETRATVLAALSNSTMRLGRMSACVTYGRQAVQAAQAAGVREQEADANVSMGIALIHLDDETAGLSSIRLGLAQALDINARSIALRAYINLSDALEGLCEHVEASEIARAGLELAAQSGGARVEDAYLAGNMAEPLIRLGRWQEAHQIATTALERDREGLFAGTLLELLAEVAVYRGDYAEATRLLAETRSLLAGDADPQFTLPLALVEAEIARGLGRPEDALRIIDEALDEDIIWVRYRWPLVWLAIRSVNDVRVRAQDRREAPPATEGGDVSRWHNVASALPDTTPHSHAYRALVFADSQAPGREALPLWSAAVVACRGSEDPYLTSYALAQQAESMISTGERSGAAVAVREARSLADRIGARPLLTAASNLARRARISLDDAAEPPIAQPASALDQLGLTEREMDVLALIAAGKPNAQIATTLFISPKTVSVHVSNILAKLNVSGRVEAAAVAHRVGLFGPTEG
jgi:DNA-binding NarL/FixJ family response regulator